MLWKDIPQDETNPTWEPWDNESMRQSHLFLEYCRRPDVVAQLGSDFVAQEEENTEALRKSKQRRSK